jgi:hypothetical protein
MVETLHQPRRSRSPDAEGEGWARALNQLWALFRPLRGVRRPASAILPMDRRDERDLADLRARRAATHTPTFDHGAMRRFAEKSLLEFHERPPRNDQERDLMLLLGMVYSAGLRGPAQDDRLALVLWWCALIEAERGE